MGSTFSWWNINKNSVPDPEEEEEKEDGRKWEATFGRKGFGEEAAAAADRFLLLWPINSNKLRDGRGLELYWTNGCWYGEREREKRVVINVIERLWNDLWDRICIEFPFSGCQEFSEQRTSTWFRLGSVEIVLLHQHFLGINPMTSNWLQFINIMF